MRVWKAVWRISFIWKILICFVWARPSEAADTAFKGVMTADYYYIASGSQKKENGFRFRRIYLTHDLKWNDAFSGRVRLEAVDAGFGSGKKMEPFVKHAYLRVTKDRHAIYMGLSGTPTWNVSESVWGYRAIERTIMDLNKIASSADMGLAYRARLDDNGEVNAQMMLGNGSGTRSEADKHKKIYGLLHFKPGMLTATAYADWEKRAGNRDRTTLAGFAGLIHEKFHGGLEGFVQWRGNVQARGISLFGAGRIGDKTKAFARGDFFDPDDASARDREYFFVGGLDFEPAKDIHIMPNVMGTAFQALDVDAEVIPRLTLYVKF